MFVINTDHIPLLCGENTLKSWKFDLSMDPIKETEIKLEDVFIDCFKTTVKHIALPLYKEEDVEDVMITEAEECFEDPPTRRQSICQVAIGDDLEDAEERLIELSVKLKSGAQIQRFTKEQIIKVR